VGEDPLGGMVEAWRSMGLPLDAWGTPMAAGAQPGGAPAADWGESWLAATTWWTDATGGQRALPDAPGRLLVEIVEGLSRAFRGRRFAFEIGGRRLHGVLKWILLDRRDGGYAVQLELTDIEWGGLQLSRLRVAGGSLAVTAPPNVSVTAADVELDGRLPLVPLVTWLDGRTDRWRLSVTDEHLVEVTDSTRPLRFVVDPGAVEGHAEVAVRAIGWRSGRLRLPAWLRLTRAMALPPLPSGLTVADARRRGAVVDCRMLLPAVSRRLDLASLRGAIARVSPLSDPR
jgi:hypothetical protein